MEAYRKLYEYMRDNRELHRVYYDMTGDWEIDKEKFIRAQQELEKSAGLDVNE